MKTDILYTQEGDKFLYTCPTLGVPVKHHREDGPAVEYMDGKVEWWYKGIRIDCQSQEKFEKKIKLLAFL